MHLQSIFEHNYLNVWVRLREQVKISPSLVHPTICSPPLPLSPYFPQILSCGLDNRFYLLVFVPPNNCPVGWTIAFIYEYLCIYIRKISRSHGNFDNQWNFQCPMESFTSWIFYVSKHAHYYTTYTVTIVTQFPYIVR